MQTFNSILLFLLGVILACLSISSYKELKDIINYSNNNISSKYNESLNNSLDKFVTLNISFIVVSIFFIIFISN